MVDSAPERWRSDSNRKWYPVDEFEFIQTVMANGQWDTDVIGPVEVAYDSSGWLHWREADISAGGSFAPDKVVHVEWATP